MNPGFDSLKIYTDGASRGNPGPAAWAYIIVDGGRAIEQRSGFLGKATNNTAEYHAVINALDNARRYTDNEVSVYSDSELVVRQITGRYQIRKEHLATLNQQVTSLSSSFQKVIFANVPREHPWIRAADGLCNATLDEHAGGAGR